MIVLDEVEGGVAVVTLDRPAARNALTLAGLTALGDALEALWRRTDLRGVVLTGRGSVFCAGADLEEMLATPDLAGFGSTLQQAGERVVEMIEVLAVPVIAALNGPALGGGAELACACDVLVGHASSYVSFRHASLGLVPAWGTVSRLAALVGRGHAARALIFGEDLDADTLVRMGLLQTLAADPVHEATRLLRRPGHPRAVTTLKRLVRAHDLEDMADREHMEFLNAFGAEPHVDALAALRSRSAQKP